MKKNKMIIAAAAALAIFGMSSSAFAAWTTGSATVSVANEATAVTKAAVGTAAAPVYTVVPALGVGSTVTVRLTGGAVFTALPVLTVTGGTLALTAPALVAGASTYTWTVATAGAGGSVETLKLADTALATTLTVDVSAAPNNAAVDVVLSAATAAGAPAIAPDSLSASVIAPATTANGPVVQLAPELSAVFAPVVDTLSTASGFTKMINPNGGADVLVSQAGTVTVTALTALPVGGVAGDAGLAATTDALVMTLTGDMNGVASIATTGGVSGSNAAGVATAPAAASALTINAGKTAATGYLTAWPATAGTAYTVALTLDGVTAHAGSVFTAGIRAVVGQAGSVYGRPLAPIAASPVITLNRSGSSFVVNRIGAGSTLKITDTSGAAVAGAQISYVAKDALGAVLPVVGAPLTATITAGSTVKLTGTQIQTAYGVLPASLVITVQSTDVLVSHRQSNVNGTTITAVSSSTNGL